MKNVLLITVDGLNFSGLGYGGKVPSPSPVMDSLLASGLTFSRTFAVGCPTQFAMPGLFLSQLPLDDGGYEIGIQGRGVSFVELLRERGYRTAGFSTAQSCAPLYGYDRGFDEFYSMFLMGEIIRDIYTRRKKHYGPAYREGRISLESCVEMISPMLEAMFFHARRSCAEKEKEIEEGSLVLSASVHNWDFPAMDRVLGAEQARFLANRSVYIDTMLRDESDPGEFVETIEGLRRDRIGASSAHAASEILKSHGIEMPVLERSATARSVADNVIGWLDRSDGECPFFLWAHFLDCHEFNSVSVDSAAPGEMDDEIRAILTLKGRMETSGSYRGHPPYDYAIQYVDGQIARIHHALEANGHLEDTLIVLTSDHGWPIGYPPRVTLDITDFYDELYRVPLSFIGPGIQPRRVDGMASTMDVPTTLLDLLGIEPSTAMRGEAINREGWAGRDHVYWEHLGRGACDFATKPMSVCVRSETHKIVCKAPPLGSGVDGELVGLFDLQVDPTEQRNLVDRVCFPEQLNWMVELVEQRVTELEAWFLTTTTKEDRDEAA